MQEVHEGFIGTQNVRSLLSEITGEPVKVDLACDNMPAVLLIRAVGSAAWRTRQLKIKAGLIIQANKMRIVDVQHCPGEIQLGNPCL